MARAPKGQGALPLPGRRSLPAYCPVRVLIDDFHHIRHLTARAPPPPRFRMPGCPPRPRVRCGCALPITKAFVTYLLNLRRRSPAPAVGDAGVESAATADRRVYHGVYLYFYSLLAPQLSAAPKLLISGWRIPPPARCRAQCRVVCASFPKRCTLQKTGLLRRPRRAASGKAGRLVCAAPCRCHLAPRLV